ncbi:MAG: hypothetical protein FJ293_13120 [Planctomycetes bacterium]|nr:hypothetical protein [Planctomycetota bacterium]
MAATLGFACSTCGRPLGARRARQGVRRHPGCRPAAASPSLDELRSALSLTTATLARWRERALRGDDETRRLCALAANEAQRLLRDLEQLPAPPAVAKLSALRGEVPAADSTPEENVR